MREILGWSWIVATILACWPGFPGRPAAAQQADTTSKAAAVEPLRTPSDRPVDIRNIRLDLRVDLEKKTVDSKAKIEFCCIRPTKRVALDAVGFEIKRVTLSERDKPAAVARYEHDSKKLMIDLGTTWRVGQTGSLQIEYQVHEPKQGLYFFAPSQWKPSTPLMVWSQGQAITNRYWIPCIDEPDQRQSTEIIITAPAGFEAVSNGKLVERKNNPDQTTSFHWVQDKPHPSYCVTLVVRQFDVVHEEWDGIPVDYYLPKGQKALAQPTFGRTREMLAFFSERFGVPYPWTKYAQVCACDFPGAQENTSATTMGEGFLIDERSLLDGSSDWVVAHEIAHQWWGDMVTCRDWSHLWLNEGFACFAEALWDEHAKGPDEYARNLFEKAADAIRDGRSRPVMDRHYPFPGSMADGRSYPKGAWILHMLRNRLGDEGFWKGIQRYATEHNFESVETFDLRRSLERATGRNLERFFYDWLERPGSPELEVATEYLPESHQVRIVAKQLQKEEAFHIPLKLVLHGSGETEPTVVEDLMTTKEMIKMVPLLGQLSRIDVDPDQAVLATIKETKSGDLWRAQLIEGPTVPLRIRAVGHFAQIATDENRQLLAEAFSGEKYWGIQVKLVKALGGVGGNAARDALLKGLRHSDARVRRVCVEQLGEFAGEGTVVSALKELLQRGDPSYAVEAKALVAYAKMRQKDAVTLIKPWLSQRSHDDKLAIAALSALGIAGDQTAFQSLLEWTEPSHSFDARFAAREALVSLGKNQQLTEEQSQHVVENLRLAKEQSEGSDRERIDDMIKRTLQTTGATAKTKSAAKTP